MTMIPEPNEKRSLPAHVEDYVERWQPSEEKHIYVFSVVVESIAVDGENEPEDRRVLTAYFTEYPFLHEIEEWAAPWLKYGYKVVESFEIEHQKLNVERHVFETVWELAISADAEDEI